MGSQSTTAESDSRLANLQFENQRLRTSRAQASQRLGVLLERLQQQQLEETTAQSHMQEDAA